MADHQEWSEICCRTPEPVGIAWPERRDRDPVLGLIGPNRNDLGPRVWRAADGDEKRSEQDARDRRVCRNRT
jgi:hypothetical protein